MSGDEGAVVDGPDVLTEAEREARDLTLAVMRHYGYTDDDVAAAEAIHPERMCDECCYDEDGETVHPGVYNELGATAALMVEVALPWHDARVAAAVAREREAAEFDIVTARSAWRVALDRAEAAESERDALRGKVAAVEDLLDQVDRNAQMSGDETGFVHTAEVRDLFDGACEWCGLRGAHEDGCRIGLGPNERVEPVCDCGHGRELHDAEATPPLCLPCGDDARCGSQVHDLMMLALHGHPDDVETALRTALDAPAAAQPERDGGS